MNRTIEISKKLKLEPLKDKNDSYIKNQESLCSRKVENL